MARSPLSKTLITLAAFFGGAGVVSAESGTTSLQGYSGLISIPDARVAAEGSIALQYNDDLESSAPAGLHNEAVENFLFNAGIWSGIELGGRISATRKTGRGREDLSGSVKWQFYADEQWRLAAGVADFAGDAQNLQARYAAASWRHKAVEVTLGAGQGPDRLDGLFGGVRFRLFPQVDLTAEHDGLEAHLGAFARLRLTERVSAQAILKLSSFEADRSSAGVGIEIRLGGRAEKAEGPVAPAVPQSIGVERTGLQGRNMVESTDSPANAMAAVRHSYDGETLVETRYGVRLRSFDAGHTTPAVAKWASGWRHSEVASLVSPGSYSGELRAELALRTVVASDFGTFDYSAAIRPTARLQGPWGLGGFISTDVPVTRTDDADPGGEYSYLRHESGVHQAMAQMALHPLPGVVGLVSLGRTEVDEVAYDLQHIDVAAHSPGGRHQLRIAYADFQPHDNLNFPSRETAVASYRFLWSQQNLSVRLGHGEFFYDDRGSTLDISRYFGDVSLGIFYKRRSDGEQLGGIELSLPLLASRPVKWKRVKFYGDPRFSHRIGTRIQGPGGRNVVTRGFMLEPLPQYDLIDDVLDGDRAMPSLVQSN